MAFKKILFIFLLAFFVGCNEESSKFLLQNSVSLQVERPDGLYNVSCLDGTLKFGVTKDEIASGSVCVDLDSLLPPSFQTYCLNKDKYPNEAATILAIEKEFNSTSCDVLYRSLKDETSLSLSGYGFKSLVPLSFFEKLRFLDVSENKVEDLTPLENLVNLEQLNLGRNAIKNLSGLGGLKKLENLNLSRNRIESVEGLFLGKGLIKLNISHNYLETFDVGDDLPHLKTLLLKRNRLSDVSGLVRIDGLSNLDVSENLLTDLSVIRGLEALERLVFYRNRIKNIGFLSSLPSIHTLDIGWNPIEDLSVLRELRGLERFSGESILLGRGIAVTRENCPLDEPTSRVVMEFCRERF